MAANTTLRIECFPSQTTTPARTDVGICLSEGGSRALAAAMGQLRGLRALNVLDKVSFISSVSGGTWAAALFTYLPTSIADDDFLGPVVAPGAITPQSLGILPANNLGSIPQNLSIEKIASTLLACIEAGYAPWDFWEGVVGTLILKPFGLWDVDAGLYPTRYYTSTPDDAQAIVARNPGLLSVSDFYVVQRPRPQLLMNGAMFSNPTIENSQLLPFQSTPTGIGISPLFKGRGVRGRDIGGGLIEPVGMGSSFITQLPGNEAQVTMPARPFSLSDIVALGSAAFAHILQAQLPHLLDVLGECLVPTYQYWPVGSVQTEPWRYVFGDGALLEGTGIATLLSYGVSNIIAFVNTNTPPSPNSLDAAVAALFGESNGLPDPSVVRSAQSTFCQVFEACDLQPLIQGLWNANQVAHGPAMFLQTLRTVDNSNFGVPGGRQVRVLWVYNVWVDAWYDALQPAVQPIVKQQSRLYKFPYYETVSQLALTPTQVNLLAHLSCWGVQTNAQMVGSLFEG